MNNRYLVLSVLLSLLAGCGMQKKSSSPPNESFAYTPPQYDPAISYRLGDITLSSFDSCEKAETFVSDSLMKRVRATLAEQRYHHAISLHQRVSQKGVYDTPMAESSAADNEGAPSSTTAKDSRSAPEDYTTTNNQEEGVDEADFIKNNGTHIFAIKDRSLIISKSWPVEELQLMSKTTVPGSPIEMVLIPGEKLLVVSNDDGDPGQAPYYRVDAMEPIYAYIPKFMVLVYDLSNLSKPNLLRQYHLSGNYVSLRRVGTSIRIVHTEYKYLEAGVQTYVETWDSQSLISLEEFDRRAEELLKKAQTAIDKITLADWLSMNDNYHIDQSEVKTLIMELGNCQWISAPSIESELGLTTITTIDTEQQAIAQKVLFSHGQQIYASTNSLYITSSHWDFWSFYPRETPNHDEEDSMIADHTFIHKFDIEDPLETTYLGSGKVIGTPLNQFSMNDYDLHLRIATTYQQVTKNPHSENYWDRFTRETKNGVFILALNENKLTTVGEVKELAPGESIYSARFAGPKGFIVTFRQVDPLFTLDLQDPTNPQVVGELKVPGYSSYIHIIDENHLLTIGRDADLDGRVKGMKVSIFDIRDMAEPKEKSTLVIDSNDYNWSEALWDHKAITYFQSRQLLALPITSYQSGGFGESWWSGYTSDLIVISVDLNEGLEKKGTLSMNDLATTPPEDYYSWQTKAQIRRSIFADDYLYALSHYGIRAAKVEELPSYVNTLSYPTE